MVSSKTRLLAEELAVDGAAVAATALLTAEASTFALIAPGDPRRSECFGSNSSHNATINATPAIRNAIGLAIIDTYPGHRYLDAAWLAGSIQCALRIISIPSCASRACSGVG